MTGESKRLLVHTFVMLAAAVACAVVFAIPEEKKSKGTILIDKRPEDLTELRLESGDKRIRVLPRKGGGYTLAFALFGKKAGAEKNRSEKQASNAVRDENGRKGTKESTTEGKYVGAKMQRASVSETRSYRASREFVRRLNDLLPLRIERELDAAGAEGKFGLDSTSKTLTFEFGRSNIRFFVGKQTYGGASTYIRKDSGGPVYLVSSSIRSIDVRPPRYMERRLFEAGRNDVDRVVVTDALGKKSRVLMKAGNGSDKWVPENDRDTTSNKYGTWVGQLFLLSADDYPDKTPEEPQVEGRVKLLNRGKLLDEIVLARTMEMGSGDSGKGNKQKDEAASTGKTVFWARSGFTGQWVKLRATTARSFFEDMPEILGRS